MRLVSKLRTGPATVLTCGVHVPPAVTQRSDGFEGEQAVPGRLPPSQMPAMAAAGAGNGRNSGGAVGIGEELSGLVFGVNPVNPLSPPSRFGELFGLVNGPKVRWSDAPATGTGPIPRPLKGWSEKRNVPAGHPP